MTVVNESVMARLRLRQIAEARGFTMSSLSRESKLTLNMVRRYWYNTANGLENGPSLTEVSLPALDVLAGILGVEPGDLIERNEDPA
jgi:transcriptional regulator with XRE-family HTH domain